jgi:putative transposase
MAVAQRNTEQLTITELCKHLGVSRSTWYRRQRTKTTPDRRTPPRKLTDQQVQKTLTLLNSERFRDEAPPTVYSTLLDEGHYLCSERTMYRILKAQKQVRQRRHQREHPVYQKPELLATGPNQVWSWDITKIKGPKSWIFYDLYVVIDIFSRCIVAWCITEYESSEQARALIGTACAREGIERNQLTVHSDRGRSMRSKCLANLYGELGVRSSFNRPHVSNDNPYSESHFKTLKYRPGYPERFGSIEDARTHMQAFFEWYNYEHRHSGIAMLTPWQVHSGQADEIVRVRQAALDAAYAANPERFVNGPPKARPVPEEVWINKPDAA